MNTCAFFLTLLSSSLSLSPLSTNSDNITPLLPFTNIQILIRKPYPSQQFLLTMYKSLLNSHQFARIFLLPNGINRDDIEMIALHRYTSLKDLMPESPPSTASPTCRGDSPREIPIKDPLLQHAAWAYLQPMTPERRSDEEWRWWRRFRHRVCWLLRCFNEVVLVVFEGWFREQLLIEFGSDERESVKQGRCEKTATSF